MIICSCFGTTDRDIRAAFGPQGDGQCPAGQGCGNCRTAVVEIASEAARREEAVTRGVATERPAPGGGD